jgi:ferredoxin-NADP reductase
VTSASQSFPDTATRVDTADAYPLQVVSVTREADAVLSLSLRRPDGGDLPAWQPGAHIDLHLPSGRIRQYSLCGSPRNHGQYRIAVLLATAGRGGSAEIHDLPLTGRQLVVRGPRNHFPLRDSPHHLFIAGGIGVTPILPMIAELGPARPWALYYGGRTRTSMAFTEQALRVGGDRVHILPKDESGRPDVESIVRTADARTAIYCCGPQGLIDAVRDALRRLSSAASLYTERFSSGALTPAEPSTSSAAQDRSFQVELRRSGRSLQVPPDRTLLEVIRDAAPDVDYSCEEGYCGACETTVLGGLPDHRDEILSPDERAANRTMMICVGRALSETLVLDL